MPKLRCACGFIHSLSAIPDSGYVVVRDRDVAEFQRLGAKMDSPDDMSESEMIAYNAMHSRLYDCPACGRLLWNKDLASSGRLYIFDNKLPE